MPQEDAVVLSLLSATPGIPAASPLQSFLDLPLVYFATMNSPAGLYKRTALLLGFALLIQSRLAMEVEPAAL